MRSEAKLCPTTFEKKKEVSNEDENGSSDANILSSQLEKSKTLVNSRKNRTTGKVDNREQGKGGIFEFMDDLKEYFKKKKSEDDYYFIIESFTSLSSEK